LGNTDAREPAYPVADSGLVDQPQEEVDLRPAHPIKRQSTGMSETEFAKVIACKHCAKLQRLTSPPVDSSGRPALFFKMSCVKCSATDSYASHDIVLLKVRPRPETSSAD
jgi:hypothetical protein